VNEGRDKRSGRLARSPAVRAWEAVHRSPASGTGGGSAGRPLGPGGSPPPSGGAIIERLKMFAGAVVAVAVGIVLLLAFATVFGLYKGTRSGWFGPAERSAVAQVGDCHRLGPVSRDGFGYWWKCQVSVRVANGRVVHTVVDRSIVTPADRGRQVEFREACKGGTTKCSYGRPVARGWKVALGLMNLIEWCLLGFCAFMALILLVRAVAGPRGFERLYDRFQGWKSS
jgi:hypothetical protein